MKRSMMFPIAAIVALGLGGCGAEAGPSEAATTSDAVAAPSAMPSEEMEETTAAPAPTEDAVTEAGGFDTWCEAFAGSIDEVKEIMDDPEAEWSVVTTQAMEPQEGQTFISGEGCNVTSGPFPSLVVSVTEQHFADAQAASLAGYREPDPYAVTREDLDFGDDALYTTYVVPDIPPPFVSYSVVVQESERVVRVAVRDYPEEELAAMASPSSPTDEALRRDQVIRLVELLQPES